MKASQMIQAKGRYTSMAEKCAYCSRDLHGEVVAMHGLFHCNYNHARRWLTKTTRMHNDNAYVVVGNEAETINIDELEEN